MNLCRVQSKQEEAAGSHFQPKNHPAILELGLSVTSHLPKTSASPHLQETQPGLQWRQGPLGHSSNILPSSIPTSTPGASSQEMLKAALNTCPLPGPGLPWWRSPRLVTLCPASLLPHHVDDQGDEKEGLTEEQESREPTQQKQAPSHGSLPLFPLSRPQEIRGGTGPMRRGQGLE